MNTIFFGGPNLFGDGDTLTKFIKFNDNKIFTDYQPKGYNYTYVPYSNYKIDFGVGFINWNQDLATLSVATTSKSNPLELSITSIDTQTCNFNNSILFIQDFFSYPSLSDNPLYANITFVVNSLPSRKYNNFGLTNFNFYFSPCFKTCLTCSSPALDSCNTCVDANAILQNGKCVCNLGFERDPYHPLYPCVPIANVKIIDDGILKINPVLSTTIFYNNIQYTSRFCQDTRSIIGGGVKKNETTVDNTDISIDLITYNMEKSFFKIKISLELITDEDISLAFPFELFYNDNLKISDFKTKQIKYLKYADAAITFPVNCFDGQDKTDFYKHYNLVFYLNTNEKLFHLKLKNNFNKFWGILNLSYDFYNCHKNCVDCKGYSNLDCLSCNSGMVLNNLNLQDFKSSCVCDEENGFVKTSIDYNPLTCAKSKSSPITFYYINDLDSEFFQPEIWKNNLRVMNKKDIYMCEYTKVMGNYNPQKNNYFMRQIDLIRNIPNFDYFTLDISFNIYFFKRISNFIVKVYLDDNYVWGSQNLATSVDETQMCNEDTTFYKKGFNVTYYNNDYFKDTLNAKNPELKIQVVPDSECAFNTDCGWGLNNLKIKINKINPNLNNTCNYRPYINCPCAILSMQCACYTGYYSQKASWGDYSCIGKFNS